MRGTLGITDSLGVTGGEYKTRERIHRDMADSRLLAIPASWSRVADSNPNWALVSNDWLGVAPSRRVVECIVSCVQPRISEGHADLASSPPSSLVRGQSRLT